MSTERARQAPGQPTGGQFAATAGTDAEIDLADDDTNENGEYDPYEWEPTWTPWRD